MLRSLLAEERQRNERLGERVRDLYAEVERLTEVEAVLRPGATNYNRERIRADKAEAALARVREALDRPHQCLMEACCNDAVRSALEASDDVRPPNQENDR